MASSIFTLQYCVPADRSCSFMYARVNSNKGPTLVRCPSEKATIIVISKGSSRGLSPSNALADTVSVILHVDATEDGSACRVLR